MMGGNWVNVTYISEESQPWRVRVRWRKGNEDNRVQEFQEVHEWDKENH